VPLPMSRTALTSEAVVGVLCAAAGLSRLPARHWPLDAALEELAERVDARGDIGLALARMPRTSGAGDRFPRIRPLLRQLVTLGLLVPYGSGSDAGFVIEGTWAEANAALLASLAESDRRALGEVAQRLCAMVTMASKNPVANGLAGSGTA
jgi:hypothetical protein